MPLSTEKRGSRVGCRGLSRQLAAVSNKQLAAGGWQLLTPQKMSPLSYCAVLFDPANPPNVLDVKKVLPVAERALKLTIQPWEVRNADDFEKVFAALSKERPDGLYVPGGGQLMRANEKRIAGFALKSRLPSMYSYKQTVEAGGLMSYTADTAESYRRVAYFVDKILKGAKPADLPVEQPTKFELVINLKTARRFRQRCSPERPS